MNSDCLCSGFRPNFSIKIYQLLQKLILSCEDREKTNKMQQSDVYYQHCLNMFWASLCPSSGEDGHNDA